MHFQNLIQTIDDGLSGKNEGLPTGLDRLDDYFSIKRRTMVTLAGASGSGKTQLVNQAFITEPFKYCFKNQKKIKIIHFSMERSIVYTHAKLLSNEIFQQYGEIISVPLMLGWYKDKKLTSSQRDILVEYESLYDSMEEHISIYQGQKAPDQIYAIVSKYAEANGKNIKINEYESVYVPNDPEEYVLVVVDHIGLTKKGKYGSKKEAIDTLVEFEQKFRDYYGYAVINVSQINRDLSKIAKDTFAPHLDHLKETGNIGEASDCVLTIFDPIRYNTKDENYGDVARFRCENTGHKFFRNITVLKNSFGIDGISVGTAFMGETGIFKTLPKADIVESWNDYDYEKIFNYEYFKNKYTKPRKQHFEL
jgi:replicative DNA helicase